MNHYLLFANQLYCYPIMRPLQQAILNRGDKVAWYLHNIPDLLTEKDGPRLKTVKAVQEYNPTAVYTPANWVPDFFPGIKVEIFHGFDTGKRANSSQDHYRIRGLFDLYCTQGPDTTSTFKALSKQYAHFNVAETGWSMLDPLFQTDQGPTLREQLNTTKPIILFGSTFSPKYSAARTLAPLIKQLSQSGRWHWLINLHPKMEQDVVDMYQSMQGQHLTFFDRTKDTIPLLKAADAMLCDTSSIFIQFLILNKPVVTFNTATPGPHLINIHQLEEVEFAIERALTYPADLMSEIKKYGDSIHPYRDGKSSERVLQATDDFIANYQDQLKPKPLNLWRKVQMRKWMHYYRF